MNSIRHGSVHDGIYRLACLFLGFHLESACYILNNVPSKSVDGHKPVLSHLRVWGYPTYVKRLQSDKLGSKSDRCLFVGYPKESKGYYFYLPEEQKLFVGLRATFLEKNFLREGTVASKIELSEVQQVEPSYSRTTNDLALIRSNPAHC